MLQGDYAKNETVGYDQDFYGFVEIYDFNKRLVAYSQDSNGTGLYYIWDGKDMNGNPVGPGKYVTKISVIDYVRGQNQCLCSDVYVAP